jgi:hypothetical protein
MPADLFLIPASWLVKSLAYRVIFRMRDIRATALTCLILGGVTFLVILPLPGILAFLAAIALGVELFAHHFLWLIRM